METLTALVAGVLGRLHGLTADAVCPGGWPWAVSLLGVGVGLLPVAGAVAVALWWRRIGSRYGFGRSLLLVGTGLLAAGLAPLLVFTATGQVFTAAAAGQRVTGLTRPELRSMDTAVCVVGPQSSYLGEGTVAEAFAGGDPVRTGLAVLALVGMPLVAALLAATSARLAFRRGPRGPVRAFWLPLLAVAVLTADVPAGSAAHLWLGAAAGASAGVPLLLLVGSPRSAAIHGASDPRRRSERPRPTGREVPARPAAPAASPVTGDGRRGWAERLAERFAARTAEPLVSMRSDAFPAPRDRAVAAGGSARPAATLVAPPLPSRASRTRRATLTRPGPVTPPVAHRSPAVPGARFRLVRRLGSGGFGRVWLAHDAQRGHIVALKAAHVRDAETEERIRREARALAAVRHPHCVQIHDLVPADSDPGLAELDGMVIVMEYVRGSSLSELVRAHGTLDDVAAAQVWASIADALDAAHQRGVLHRDVKPGNIVVDADGRAHLIDFGIARRTGEATLTAAGSVLGTPDFLAPEVARGGRATPRSDAWQLAAAIGYALTGSPPRGEHADAMSGLRAAALGGPPTHLPRSAHRNLLRAALDPDPARRPSLRAVHTALEAWLHPAGERSDGAMTAGSSGR